MPAATGSQWRLPVAQAICIQVQYNNGGLRGTASRAERVGADAAPEVANMNRTIASTATILLLAACASAPSESARNVKDGDPAKVNRDCKLLGTVNGRSLFGGVEASRQDDAMLDARAKAAAMGATHVVFINVDTSGMFNTGHAAARAYKC